MSSEAVGLTWVLLPSALTLRQVGGGVGQPQYESSDLGQLHCAPQEGRLLPAKVTSTVAHWVKVLQVIA